MRSSVKLVLRSQWLIQDFPDVGRGAERQPLNFDQKAIIWQDICPKLHQNERNWTEEPPLDPPSVIVDQLFM